MMSNDMCSIPSNMEPINSESTPVTSTNVDQEDQGDQEYSGYPPLPQPTPTDFSNLFKQDGEKLNARRHKPGHIPRPPNAFILFRRDLIQQMVPKDLINDHRDLSRLAGCIWRKMSDTQKKPWFEKAELERRYHLEVFPEYRYSPTVTDRPKRVYRRRKRLMPLEEILLRHPHQHLEPSLSTTQHEGPQVLMASSAPGTQFSPPISYVDSCASSTNWQDLSIPGNYGQYQHDPSMALSNQAIYPEQFPFPSPGPYFDGFIDDSRQSSEAVPDWKFSHLELSAHYDRGCWQSSMTGGAQYVIPSGSSEQASMNLSFEKPGSLLKWRHSEASHQALYPEANQAMMSDPHFSYGGNPEADNSSHHPLIAPSMPPPVDVIYGEFLAHDLPRYPCA